MAKVVSFKVSAVGALARPESAVNRSHAERLVAVSAHGGITIDGALQDSRDMTTAAVLDVNATHAGAALVDRPVAVDVWNGSIAWVTADNWPPLHIISNVHGGWGDKGFISLDWLIATTFVLYPAVLLCLISVLSLCLSCCVWKVSSRSAPGSQLLSRTQEFADSDAPLFTSLLSGNDQCLPAWRSLWWPSQWLLVWWWNFCTAVPCLLTFGGPVLLCVLARPHPQEIFVLMKLFTPMVAFAQAIYIGIFGAFALLRMEQALNADFECDGPTEGSDVVHWIIIPQYREASEVLSATLTALSRSLQAKKAIKVVLAVEEREEGSVAKANELKQRFQGCFADVVITLHPAGLRNDPPGKASNVAWAFGELQKRLTGDEVSQTIITIADADSDFHTGYFACISRLYARMSASERATCIWQSPIFHCKNYHRQPSVVLIGNILTSMFELATLGDPNAVRFPYSTYSLPFTLAQQVGGWDAEWIAEDWHMGIKCFLLTHGRAEIKPVLLPVVNYSPEEGTWWGTLMARWAQAKRHALGFTDVAYFYMVMPVLASRARWHELPSVFWQNFTIPVKLVNVHVMLGISWIYIVIAFFLEKVMRLQFAKDRFVGYLVERAGISPGLLMLAGAVLMGIMFLIFLRCYALLKHRIEPEEKGVSFAGFQSNLAHLIFLGASALAFSPVFFVALMFATWKAALTMLLGVSYKYEVASKPTKESRL